ncbi:MAG: hypothetical protein JKX72_01415 [Robiginitomaculum sp.]|nr:hypothetical protein [Robiginitomaculum sp.]
MRISKFILASASIVALSLTTIPMTAAAGSTIANASDCQFEGGTMTNVKGSDYCLVSIRPKEYSGAEYDGNQLGVVDCPGSKLNDGVFCMYPVTVKKSNSTVSSLLGAVQGSSSTTMKDKAGTALLKNKIFGGGKSTTDILVGVAKDEAKKKAEDEAKKAAAKLLGGQ